MTSSPPSESFEPAAEQPPRVLIVEDHDLTRRFLAENLSADGFVPMPAGSVGDARQLIASEPLAAAVLDLSLPDLDGLTLLGELRGVGGARALDRDLPVLILSGRGSEIDRVRGLERGADDYLCKPFSYAELRLRLQSLLRRSQGRISLVRIRVGSLELDPRAREAWIRGEPLHLSKKEFTLLALLASAPTRTFTRTELLREVWGYEGLEAKTRTLDSHAHRLRVKLSAPRDRYVLNVWGVGYKLIEGVEP